MQLRILEWGLKSGLCDSKNEAIHFKLLPLNDWVKTPQEGDEKPVNVKDILGRV